MGKDKIDWDAILRAQNGECDSDDSTIMTCNESVENSYELFSDMPTKKKGER